VRDEVALVLRQALPVVHVVAEVHLLDSPEAGDRLLVHVPDSIVFDREQHEAHRILLQERLVAPFPLISVVGSLLLPKAFGDCGNGGFHLLLRGLDVQRRVWV